MGAISDPGVMNIGASLASGLLSAGGIGGGIGSLMASPGFRNEHDGSTDRLPVTGYVISE